MKQCLKITMSVGKIEGFLSAIKKNASSLGLEGIAQTQQVGEQEIVIHVCGENDAMESFVDQMYKMMPKYELSEFSLEPFLKTKDYRGVFRIIE